MNSEKNLGLGLIIGSLICLLIVVILLITGIRLYIDIVFLLVIIFGLGFITSLIGGLKMYLTN